jgi:hypothetical protein
MTKEQIAALDVACIQASLILAMSDELLRPRIAEAGRSLMVILRELPSPDQEPDDKYKTRLEWAINLAEEAEVIHVASPADVKRVAFDILELSASCRRDISFARGEQSGRSEVIAESAKPSDN